MKKSILPLLCAAAFAAPVLAEDCNRDEAMAKWEKAEAHNIILGAGVVNNTMSFQVDEGVWESAELDARLGMVKAFECIIAGPGNILTEAHVLNKGGEVLAVWDGLFEELDFQ